MEAEQLDLKCECGCSAFTLTSNEIHGFGVRCATCGKFQRWTGRGKEKKSTIKHRERHRKNGEMVCDLCGITESEAKQMGMHFEIDHREAEQFGGKDEFENTRPLCSACHYDKTARENRTKGIRKLLERLHEREAMFTDYLAKVRGSDDDRPNLR